MMLAMNLIFKIERSSYRHTNVRSPGAASYQRRGKRCDLSRSRLGGGCGGGANKVATPSCFAIRGGW